ncbi:YcgN family cysteine cluster protein [Rhodobacteraceae bacterium D3-12]|nr:YcgN family cysteine cluster protein [Rhodobacteraceae bacterium D3-12]
MSDDPINRDGLARRFWETTPLAKLSDAEWEALCDGCGKCCLNKLEDEDSGEVALTRVACRLFDDATCRCAKYETRRQFVPECISLTTKTIAEHAYWLPQTCAYRRLWAGEALPTWHPLLTGTAQSVHDAGVSVQQQTVSEIEIHEDDWEAHIIEEPL